MRTSTVVKCDLIPTCADCKLNGAGIKCPVLIPDYIPKESIPKLIRQFREKYIK